MHTIKIKAGTTIETAAHLLIMEARLKRGEVSTLFNDITLTATPESSVIDIILQFDRAMFERQAKEFAEKQRVEALTMHWQRVGETPIDDNSWYLTRSFPPAEEGMCPFFRWRGDTLKRSILNHLSGDVIPVDPIWIAKITDPEGK